MHDSEQEHSGITGCRVTYESTIFYNFRDADAKEDAEPEEKFVPKNYNGKAPKAGKGKKDKPKKATPKPAPKPADEEQLTFGDFGTEEAAG